LAVAVASCGFDQHVVRSGREHLFEGSLYRQVFPNNKSYYYLVRYFLFKEVKKASRLRKDYSYSRALATNYLWEQFQEIIDCNIQARRRFVRLCLESDTNFVKAIGMASKAVFLELSHFYRANCGKGSEKIDISQFYRNRKGRNRQFKEEHTFNETNSHRLSVVLVGLQKQIGWEYASAGLSRK